MTEVFYLTHSIKDSRYVFPEEIIGIEQLDLSATSVLAFPIVKRKSRYEFPKRLSIQYSLEDKTCSAVLNRIEKHHYWVELEGYTFLFSSRFLGYYGGEWKTISALAELVFENGTTFFNALTEKHLFFVGSSFINE